MIVCYEIVTPGVTNSLRRRWALSAGGWCCLWDEVVLPSSCILTCQSTAEPAHWSGTVALSYMCVRQGMEVQEVRI